MFNKIKCLFGFHDLILVEVVSDQTKRMKCINCCKEFAVNHNMKLIIPWDEEVDEFYRDFNEILNKCDIIKRIKNV